MVAVRRRRNSLRHTSGARRNGVRNATAFRGESEQDRFPLVRIYDQVYLENVPVERFQRICLFGFIYFNFKNQEA